MPGPHPQSSRALHRALLAVLVFLSGAASLVYEVLWLKELGLLFGSTAYAASTTLAVFFLGLAVGGAVFGRLSPRLRSPLRTYAWLELGIAGSAVAYFLLLEIYFRLYGPLYDTLVDSPAAFNAARVALAILALLPPAALMGGTLPLLGQHLVRRPDELGRIGSFLYAVNTLGAATGAFLAGFVLPLALGFDRAYLLAMAVNVAVAGLAWRLAAADEQRGTPRRDLPADNGLHRNRGKASRGRPAASPAANASCPAWLLVDRRLPVGRVRARARGALDADVRAGSTELGLHLLDHPRGVPGRAGDRLGDREPTVPGAGGAGAGPVAAPDAVGPGRGRHSVRVPRSDRRLSARW